MRHNFFIAVTCVFLLAVVTDVRASTFFYAHPELVDLSKDRNVTSDVVNDYNWQTYAQYGSTASYTLDLGSNQTVGQIQFQTHRANGNFGPDNWTIQTSDDGNVWTTRATGVGTDPVYAADFTGNPTPFTTQHIRYLATGQLQTYGDLLEDVRVYGDARVPIGIRDTLNIAGHLSNGGTASNSQFNDEDPNDGSESANTYGVEVFTGNNLDVTLNDSYLVNGMRWGMQTQYGQLTGYQVYTLLNGVQSVNPIYTSTGPATASQYIDFGASYDATGLRVVVTSTTENTDGIHRGGFVNELEVFGNPVPEPTAIGLLTVGGTMLVRRRR